MTQRRFPGLEHLTDEEYEELRSDAERRLAEIRAEFAAERRDKERRGVETDEDLDSKTFQWMSERVEGDSDRILGLPEPQRAYYVTRLFEWWSMNDGPDAMPREAPELLDAIGPGYQTLGLVDAAHAFDRLRGSKPVRRLLSDESAELLEAERQELNDLLDAIGVHDTERIHFVRAHPEAFES